MNREELLAKGKPEIVPVKDIPRLGEVLTRKMSGALRDAWMTWTLDNFRRGDPSRGEKSELYYPQRGSENYRAKLVSMALCGADGALLFDHANPEDVAALGDLDDGTLDCLFRAVREINKLSRESEEELEKNSGEAASEPIGSDSPRSSDAA